MKNNNQIDQKLSTCGVGLMMDVGVVTKEVLQYVKINPLLGPLIKVKNSGNTGLLVINVILLIVAILEQCHTQF